MTLDERLEKIEAMLMLLVGREAVKDWYSVEEFARLVDRAPFTVREWARQGRINATKKESGRGAHLSWAVSRTELVRFQREGLLPGRHIA